jgi:glycerophosphoryl diester phosphodiesterase
MPEPLDGKTIAFAHRGFSALKPENSMAAFAAAVELGYRYLETDARVTADGVAVVFHDPMLDRVTNDLGRLDRLPWDVVRKARIMGSEPIPLLEDVLATFTDRIINLDVKSNMAVGPALDAIRRTNAWSRIRVSGFSHARLVALRAAVGPKVATVLSPREIGILARTPKLFKVPEGVDWAVQLPTEFLKLPLVTPQLIESAHALGLPVHVWTINRVAEMRRLLDLGVDGIMTDEASLLKQLLEERGQWP